MEAYHNQNQGKTPKPTDNRQYQQIPEALRQRPQWMGTKFKPRPGKPGKVDKPPYCVRAGQPAHQADKTNPDNWTTFDEAVASLGRGMDAIGYVFTEEDPFFCVDLDDVLDPETGEIEPGAATIIHTMGSYAELSCSGKGVHIIAVGTKPEYAKCKSSALGFDLEIYEARRFVVLTGSQIYNRLQISECQGEFEELCEKLWPKQDTPRPKPPNTGPVDLEDAVLLERARNARSGPKFHKLYDLGDTSGHDSHSNADYALLNMLIFWTAGDRERIISLFEASALYRQKEKHRGYAALSTDNALASYKGSFYQPRRTTEVREEAKEEEAPDPLSPYLDLMLDPSEWTGKKAASAYKTYVALVSLAAEHGIFDDEGNLRIGCDVRRLAEAACTRRETVRLSGLPELFKMKLMRTRRPKGAKTTTFVLPNPRGRTNRANKVSTHFIGTGYAHTKNTIETLRLLTRMRSGKSESSTLLRLGMPAMFVAVAMVERLSPIGEKPLTESATSRTHGSGTLNQARGYSDTELAEATGRRVRTLRDSAGKPGVLSKMKAAGILREPEEGVFRLTQRFRDAYERHLEHSGITHTEREQKRQHEDDRRRRASYLKTQKRTSRLRGKEQMERLLKKRQGDEAAKEQTPTSVGDCFDDHLKAPKEPPSVRIGRLIREGMSRKFARIEVLAHDHPLRCDCKVCG
jgi:putative DNA primase/helicase